MLRMRFYWTRSQLNSGVRLPQSFLRGIVNDLDALFDQIRARFAESPPGSAGRADIAAHLRSLARWHREPADYPDVAPPSFPIFVDVAYAVCHPECGAQEFIIEGSTQECQHCGGLLFRIDSRRYVLDEPATT